MAGFFKKFIGKIFGKTTTPKEYTNLHIEEPSIVEEVIEDVVEETIEEIVGETYDDFDDYSYIDEDDEEDYIPTVYYANIIRGYIDSLPDERTFYNKRTGMFTVDIASKKNVLFEIMDDSINEIGEEAYEEYLASHQEEISTYCSIVIYASDQESVETALTNLATALNMSPLSHSQAERVSIYTETMYGW